MIALSRDLAAEAWDDDERSTLDPSTPCHRCGHTEAARLDTPAGDWPRALCHCPDYVHDPHWTPRRTR